MNYMFPRSPKCSIEEFIQSLFLQADGSPDDDIQRLIMKFFPLFCKSGLDYYELLAMYSSFSHYSEANLRELLWFAPKPLSAFSVTRNNIRKAIPRWTASRYHSAPIDSIIGDIQQKILSGTLGLFCYNSNLNPKNQRSLNDLYILIIAGNENRWFDINRKCTYRFLQGGM